MSTGAGGTDDAAIGAFVVVTLLTNNSVYHIREEHWDEIDGAMHNWIERKIDRLLALVSTNGADCLVPASQISDVFRSTAETREHGRRLDEAMKAESGFSE